MAFVTEFICNECGQTKTEVVVPSRVCANCRVDLARLEESTFCARLDRMTLEKRIRRMELELYRLDANRRLEKLEVKNVQY